MAHCTLSIDVYCKPHNSEVSYRVFVDEDLQTERTWIWPINEIMIREHLEVEIPNGDHRITIEDCTCNNSVFFKNMVVNNIAANNTEQQQSTTFVV